MAVYTVLWIAFQKSSKTDQQQVVKKTAQIQEKQIIAPVQPMESHVIYIMSEEELEQEAYYDSLELMAICIEAEAGNQGLEGKRLVADVILNRVDDKTGEWENSIEGVITQLNQFASYWDGNMESIYEPSEETYKAIRIELQQRSYLGIYYFREGTWPEYGTRWKKVGDHYFSGK